MRQQEVCFFSSQGVLRERFDLEGHYASWRTSSDGRFLYAAEYHTRPQGGRLPGQLSGRAPAPGGGCPAWKELRTTRTGPTRACVHGGAERVRRAARALVLPRPKSAGALFSRQCARVLGGWVLSGDGRPVGTLEALGGARVQPDPRARTGRRALGASPRLLTRGPPHRRRRRRSDPRLGREDGRPGIRVAARAVLERRAGCQRPEAFGAWRSIPTAAAESSLARARDRCFPGESRTTRLPRSFVVAPAHLVVPSSTLRARGWPSVGRATSRSSTRAATRSCSSTRSNKAGCARWHGLRMAAACSASA